MEVLLFNLSLICNPLGRSPCCVARNLGNRASQPYFTLADFRSTTYFTNSPT